MAEAGVRDERKGLICEGVTSHHLESRREREDFTGLEDIVDGVGLAAVVDQLVVDVEVHVDVVELAGVGLLDVQGGHPVVGQVVLNTHRAVFIRMF